MLLATLFYKAVIDIKKTALVILIIALLSNSFTQYAYADNDYDHDELMQYEGYGKAMFDSVVEQTTFITGQYTDNKDYVSESMNQIKGYADFWYNEYNDFTSSCYQSSAMNCLGEMVERGGAYVLTLGDWVKNLFNDYETSETDNSVDTFGAYVTTNRGAVFPYQVKSGYVVVATSSFGTARIDNSYGLFRIAFTGSYGENDYLYESRPFFDTTRSRIYITPVQRLVGRDIQAFVNGIVTDTTFSNDVNQYGSFFGFNVHIETVEGEIAPITPSVNPNLQRITSYIRDGGMDDKTVVVPKLKPTLVCPNGNTIQMSIDGSTFVAVNGSVMLVNKDGTAEVNGEICSLNWEKPVVQYNPVTGQPEVIQPDGTKTDLETGSSESAPVKPPSHTDLKDCDGVLCGIGKVLDGLGGVVESLTGMVKSLLDGLVGLFVPKDLGFISEEFSRITKKLNEKIAITDSLKEAITSVFGGDGGNPLADISINLPITNEPLTFGNVSFIEEGVPILRKVMSAIVVLYTIVYVYRKITGRGGVMER